MEKLKKVTSHHLFLPVFALALLLLFNAFATPGFFSIEIQNGQLFGRVIDILNRASILIVLALGMTFVIATGGIDISQGSVIAISGAVCCSLIGGAADGTAQMPLLPACLIAVAVCAVCGVWNGFLVSKLNIQPMVATLILMSGRRGIAMLITKGQNVTVYYKPFTYIGNTIPGSPLPTTIYIAAAMVALVVFIQKKTSVGLFVQSVGINAEASRRTGLKVTGHHLHDVHFLRRLRRHRGTDGVLHDRRGGSQQRGLNMEMDAPCGSAGRHAALRRQVLYQRLHHRCYYHPDPDDHAVRTGCFLRAVAGMQGCGGDPDLPDSVRKIQEDGGAQKSEEKGGGTGMKQTKSWKERIGRFPLLLLWHYGAAVCGAVRRGYDELPGLPEASGILQPVY